MVVFRGEFRLKTTSMIGARGHEPLASYFFILFCSLLPRLRWRIGLPGKFAVAAAAFPYSRSETLHGRLQARGAFMLGPLLYLNLGKLDLRFCAVTGTKAFNGHFSEWIEG